MAIYRGGKTKLCRALGINVFGLPKIDKYVARRNNKNKAIVKKKSEYGVQLQEKQIAKHTFGVSESQLRKYYVRAIRSKNITSQEILRQMETRVDNILFRSGIASSRLQGRQFISHGHFELNGKRINTPSINVRIGDKLKLRKKSSNIVVFSVDEKNKQAKSLKWIKVDNKNKEVLVESMPESDELEQSIKINLIVEYFSRK